MRAFEFETEIQDHSIKIPPELEAKLPADGHYRVILLASEEDETWQSATTNAFLAGYADSDSIYDRL